jgi:hypothetical protein
VLNLPTEMNSGEIGNGQKIAMRSDGQTA